MQKKVNRSFLGQDHFKLMDRLQSRIKMGAIQKSDKKFDLNWVRVKLNLPLSPP